MGGFRGSRNGCVEDKTLVVPEGSIPLATPVSSPDCWFDERETLGPGDVSEPPLDERVLRDSAFDAVVDLELPSVGWPVSSLRTLVSHCKFMSEYA